MRSRGSGWSKGSGRNRPRRARPEQAAVRTLRCMQGMVSGLLLVGAFVLVAAAATVVAVRLHRLTRAGRPPERPDA